MWSFSPLRLLLLRDRLHEPRRCLMKLLTVCGLLARSSLWPGFSQVFKLERERTNSLGET
jgi:hypothetical protein